MRKKKLAIIGAGNAGCMTALHYYFYGKDLFDIVIYYDENSPMERVGQGSTISVPLMISSVFDLNFTDRNFINATRKEGILYENWGKVKDKIYHSFNLNTTSIHYVPQLLSNLILESGFFEVVNKKIINPESEIDCDYIFDCRGKNNREASLYTSLTDPLNSVILSRKDETIDCFYTKTVATPNGWTFVIPNVDSTSYGYLYNNEITSYEKATEDFISRFDVVPDGHLTFSNYIAKDCFYGERTILNGNRLSFLEPLEATSTDFYLKVCRYTWDYLVGDCDKERCNQLVQKEMKQIQNYVMWHYQSGSKFDTPFWDYAKSLSFNPDQEFNDMLRLSQQDYVSLKHNHATYSQWSSTSFKNWFDNT